MKKRQISKKLALLISMVLLFQLVVPATVSADDGRAVPVLQVAVAPGTAPDAVKATVADAVYGSEAYALAVNITEAPVDMPEPGEPVPAEGDYLIAGYESGADITAGVAADKYLQVYALYKEGGQSLVAAFYQKQLAENDIKQPVTVIKTAGTITAFVELEEAIRWQNTVSPELPETVNGTVDGNAAAIPVTWEADHVYDVDSPETGLYVFTAQPGEGYRVDAGAEAPRITVYMPAAPRMMMRMAGAATQVDPLVITTAAQLVEIAALVNAGRLETFLFNNSSATVYLELGNDLDLSSYGENWNGGKGWVPIGSDANPFKGSFDGSSKTITGLYINDSAMDYAGLFGCVNAYSGSVHDMSLTGVSINARDYVGGIAGSTSDHGIKVYNCFVDGSVKGNSGVGGVAGYFYGSLNNCLSACKITATGADAGGVVGFAGMYSQINACYATGTVSGGIHIGGVAGIVYNSVTNCAALNPSVSGSSHVGRVAGYLLGGSLSGSAAFAGMTGGGSDKTASGLDGEDITAANIKADGTIGNRFTASDGWTIENGKLPGRFGAAVELPVHITDGTDPNFSGEGTAASPFLIGTAEKLVLLATLVNNGDTAYNDKYYKLIADIDLSGYGASFNGSKGWIPIGNDPNFFKGHFDGSGKTIAGLYINDGSRSYAGLFGYVSGGTLESFTVNGAVSGNNNVGVAVGYLNNATMQSCHASGTVSGKSYNVGGVAGDIYNSSRMLSCSAAVVVSGESYTYNLGGVAGTVEKSSIIQDCYATGNVSGGNTSGGSAGGVAGNVYDGANTVRNCYATGAVSSKNYVGGVAGTVEFGGHTVQNCAALNSSLSSGGIYVGRVAGYKASGSTLDRNVAFDWILNKLGGQLSTADDGAGTHGASRTADNLQVVMNLPGDFSSAPWTSAPSSLPGLSGKTVAMPAHITTRLTGYFAGGTGASGDPYVINTGAQLVKLAELVNAGDTNYNDKYYKLIADLDLSHYNAANTGFNGSKGWVPIGKAEAKPFKGCLDGNHKTVSGLYINDEFQNYYAGGLFGYLINGSVSNLAVTDVNITTTGMGSAGVVAGYMDSYSVVQGCYTTGVIRGSFSGVGGIAGAVGLMSVVQNCYTTAAVSGSGTMGGIAGTAGSGATIQNCLVTGNFTGGSYTGGVVGFLATGTIQNCVVLSPGVTQDDWVKRILGRAYGTNTLANNYAFSGMLSGGTDKTASGLDGADLSIQTALRGSLFWQDNMNWDTNVWAITSDKLPILIGFPSQSGDGGLYLTERDIQYANVTVNGTYTYTGSPIIPDITVTFDGTMLAKGTDYTASVTSTDGIGTSAGTNAGNVTLTLDGIGNYTGTKTDITFTINKITLTDTMITLADGSFTYTGLEQEPDIAVENSGQTLTLGGDYLTFYTDNIDAGTASVSIQGIGNYQGTVSKNFTIGKASLTITGGAVAAKSYDDSLAATITAVTFDGLQNSETLMLGSDYILTDATYDSKEAGSGKTVTDTVVLGGTSKASNYILSDGDLSIAGQTIDKAAAPTGVNQTFPVVKGYAAGYEFDLASLLPAVAGSLGTVTYSPVISVNSGGVLDADEFAYVSGSTLTLPVQAIAPVGATAAITVTITSDNYNSFTAVITVTIIDTVPLTVAGLTVGEKPYDGTTTAILNGTASLVTTNVEAGDEVMLSGIPSAAFANADAGNNKTVAVTGLSLTGNAAYKYRLELSGFAGTIEPKVLTANMLTVEGASFTYTGVAQAPGITVKDGSTTLTPGIDYENVAYANNINAGTANVSIAGKGNYQGTVSKDFTIGKAPLTITGGTVDVKIYDNTTGATVNTLNFNGLQNSEILALNTDCTVTGAVFDSANAGGGKVVTAIVALNNTAKANNYILENGSLTLMDQAIQKATIADVTFDMLVATNLAKTYTTSYQEFENLLNSLTGKALGTVDYSLTTVENEEGVLAVLPPAGPVSFPSTISVASVTAAGREAKIIGTVASANYSDFTVTSVIRTVDRIPMVISGVTMAGGIYSGSPYAYSGTPVFTPDAGGSPVSLPEFDVLYASTDSGGYSSATAPQNAGAYQLTISVPNSNPVYTGSKSYPFTIARRPVTLKSDNKSMIAGGTLPVFTYTVDGQLSGETAFTGNPILSCAADGKTAGSYPITMDLAGITYTGNYTAASPAFVGGTLTVNNPSSGGNDSGGRDTSSGGSSGGIGTPPAAPPVQVQQTQATIIGSLITATTATIAITDSSSTATATLTSDQLSSAINSAVAQSVIQGGSTSAQVNVMVQAPSTASSVQAVLPQGSLQQAVQSGIGGLIVGTPLGSISFDSGALNTIAGAGTDTIMGSDTVTVIIARASADSFSPQAQQLVGGRPVINATVTSGGSSISQLGGTATLYIPYTSPAGENPNALVGCYISPSGSTEILGGRYVNGESAGGGMTVGPGLLFGTGHLSTYAVGYNKVTFRDVAKNAWYSKAVDFIAAREISTGTGDGNFSPEAKLTRGQFLVMLMKAYGMTPDANPKDNFIDAGSIYYTNYLAAAKRLGISNGVGGNRFAPEKEITRQEMVTLLYNALKVINRLPQSKAEKSLSDFSDAGQIEAWAKEAFVQLLRTETISGNAGKLFPGSTTTRAEMAQVLYNLLIK